MSNLCMYLFYRSNFHLLRKNEKLLRELKNLDSRQWWENTAQKIMKHVAFLFWHPLFDLIQILLFYYFGWMSSTFFPLSLSALNMNQNVEWWYSFCHLTSLNSTPSVSLSDHAKKLINLFPVYPWAHSQHTQTWQACWQRGSIFYKPIAKHP